MADSEEEMMTLGAAATMAVVEVLVEVDRVTRGSSQGKNKLDLDFRFQ